MARVSRRRGLCAAVLLLCGATASPDTRDGGPGEPAEDPAPLGADGGGRTVALFPPGDVYAPYLADPHRPVNAAIVQWLTRTEIPGATDLRPTLRAGGRFGLLRFQPETPEGRTWQLSVEAGLSAQFDWNKKLDSIAWDGNYGLTLTTASGGPLAMKLGLLHRSAHLGDEYAEDNDAERISYTREELAIGVDWRPSGSWRVYLEAGHAYKNRASGQEPGRGQLGVEFESARTLLGDRFSWYLAAETSATQERDWRVDAGGQLGLVTTSGQRRWRIGLEYYHGRPAFGEFYVFTEAWVAVGIWMDL